MDLFSFLSLPSLLHKRGLVILGPALSADEVVHDVHGHREDDGGVVLGRDAVEGLEVAELEREKGDTKRVCRQSRD